jgi:hypothetical protein
MVKKMVIYVLFSLAICVWSHAQEPVKAKAPAPPRLPRLLRRNSFNCVMRKWTLCRPTSCCWTCRITRRSSGPRCMRNTISARISSLLATALV